MKQCAATKYIFNKRLVLLTSMGISKSIQENEGLN